MQPVTSIANNSGNLGGLDSPGVWSMAVGYPMIGMGAMGPMGTMIGDMGLGAHISHAHSYGPMGMGMLPHESSMLGTPMLGEQIIPDGASQVNVLHFDDLFIDDFEYLFVNLISNLL